MPTYTGTAANNNLTGSTSADDMYGLDGNDTLSGGNGTDSLFGGNGNDSLLGGLGDDALDSGDGNDTVVGGAGADQLSGGAGTDSASYSAATSGVNASLSAGGTVGEAAGDTYSSIEGLIGSNHNDTLTGDAGDNYIRGLGGTNLLDGGLGADTIDGAGGSDTVDYSWGSSPLYFDMRTSTYSGPAAGDSLILVEGAIGTIFNDTMIGTVGGVGKFSGGPGDDVYMTRGQVTELPGEGFDELIIDGNSANVQVPNNVEKITYIGAGGLIAEGSSGSDWIVGGNQGDTFYPSDGADTMDGAGGVDIIYYNSTTSAIVVDLTTNANSGAALGDVLLSVENVRGSGYSDYIFGSSADNRLQAFDGDDFVHGAQGNDTLEGINGHDTIHGGQGDDTISGAAGNDWISGDAGNDEIYAGTGSDIVYAYSGMGADRVIDFTSTVSSPADRVQVDPGSAYTVGIVGADVVVDFGGGNQLILVNKAATFANFHPGWIF